MTKRQKGEKTKDKKTERQKTKTKVRVQYCDIRAVSHSCDVFFIISGTLKLELRDKEIVQMVDGVRRHLRVGGKTTEKGHRQYSVHLGCGMTLIEQGQKWQS